MVEFLRGGDFRHRNDGAGFQRLGMMPVSTDSWNSCESIDANSSAQVRRRWPEMLSGPEKEGEGELFYMLKNIFRLMK